MGMYRKEWNCCGSVTETDAWEPDECPFCTAPPPRQPLTDGLTEIIRSFGYTTWGQSIEIAEAIKAAHGIKGGA